MKACGVAHRERSETSRHRTTRTTPRRWHCTTPVPEPARHAEVRELRLDPLTRARARRGAPATGTTCAGRADCRTDLRIRTPLQLKRFLPGRPALFTCRPDAWQSRNGRTADYRGNRLPRYRRDRTEKPALIGSIVDPCTIHRSICREPCTVRHPASTRAGLTSLFVVNPTRIPSGEDRCRVDGSVHGLRQRPCGPTAPSPASAKSAPDPHRARRTDSAPGRGSAPGRCQSPRRPTSCPRRVRADRGRAPGRGSAPGRCQGPRRPTSCPRPPPSPRPPAAARSPLRQKSDPPPRQHPRPPASPRQPPSSPRRVGTRT